MIKLPKTIKIGGAVWKIITDKHVMDSDESERLCGICKPSEKEIHISPNEDIEVFLHELVHAVCSFMGIEDEDEKDEQIDAIANAIRMVLSDNKKFFIKMIGEL